MMHEQLKDVSLDQFASAIEDLKPKSLDDIIRKNRESFQIRLATQADIQERLADVDANNPKDIFDNWSLVAMVGKDKKTFLRLVGEFRSSKETKISSNLFAIDMKKQVLHSFSGSVYKLGIPNKGEPAPYQLIFICSFLHDIGIGSLFGVPHFFY